MTFPVTSTRNVVSLSFQIRYLPDFGRKDEQQLYHNTLQQNSGEQIAMISKIQTHVFSTSDLTINIGDGGHKVIDDINEAVMGIVEKREVPLELLIYAQAAYLEQTKQAGLELGNKSHRIEMIIQVARNDVINGISGL